MSRTLEELASQLDSDPEFKGLPQGEQDTVFAELAKDIEAPSAQPSMPSSGFEKSRQAVEAEISSRPSSVRNLSERGFTGPLKGIPTAAFSLLERGEGTIADIGLGIQRGASLQEILGDINKTAAGQRPAQYGDILRASNLPVLSSRPISATMGLSMLPGGAKSVVDLGKIGLKGAVGGAKLAKTAVTKPIEAMGAVARGIRSIPQTTRQGFPAFGQKVRSAYSDISKTLMGEFDDAMTKLEATQPNTTINIRNVIERAKLIAQEDPAVARRLDSAVRRAFPKGDVTLAELLNNPDLANQVTLRQSQQVIASLKAVPSLPGKLAKQGSSYTDIDMELLDMAKDIRHAQLEAFPQFKESVSKYASVSDALRKTKKFFTERSLEGSVKGGFGSAEEEKIVGEILPNNVMQAIKDARLGQSIKHGAGVVGKTAVPVGVGGALLKLLFGQAVQR